MFSAMVIMIIDAIISNYRVIIMIAYGIVGDCDLISGSSGVFLAYVISALLGRDTLSNLKS